MPAPLAFMQTRFSLRNHRPPTDLGCFDLDFNPASGLLKTTIRYTLDFVNAGRVWTAQEKADFKGEFGERVSSHWDRQFSIRCRKSGWDNVKVLPRFAFVEAGTDAPHFTIKCISTTGTSNTAVRPDNTAKFGMQATSLTANAGMQRANIVRDLKLPVVIGGGSGVVAPGMGAQFSMTSMELMKRIAENAITAFGARAREVGVTITGFGSRDGKRNAERVRDTLVRFGLTCRWTLRGETSAPRDVDATHGILVAFNPRDVDHYAIVDASADRRMSQATIVHEFGHMLGLPDEYNALCSQSVGALATAGRITGAESAVRLMDMSTSAKDAAKSDAIERNQKAFVTLCTEAGVPVPPFGRANDSVMSCGSRFLPSHCITVWDGLCQMTKAHVARSEWELRLA